MARRSDALAIAVLGLLQDAPLHGYELRKRLDLLIGALRRRISFGSLYPALRDLEARGWVSTEPPPDRRQHGAAPLAGRRHRVVYHLTAAGEQRLSTMLATSGPASWEDEQFDVHFAFFGRTDATTRLRILEGRRTRVQERLDRAAASPERPGGRRDTYLAELHRHSVESLQRELAWLDGLAERERSGRAPAPPGGTTPTSTPPGADGAGR